ncbi:MAG: hypothetical protein EB096_07455 [Betaproteobacteria bacterium]|nr:hypothetical protein [Betaproteobacteria bacterium]
MLTLKPGLFTRDGRDWAGDPHPLGVGGESARQPRDRRSRPFHQGRGGVARQGCQLQRSRAGNPLQRPGSLRGDPAGSGGGDSGRDHRGGKVGKLNHGAMLESCGFADGTGRARPPGDCTHARIPSTNTIVIHLNLKPAPHRCWPAHGGASLHACWLIRARFQT